MEKTDQYKARKSYTRPEIHKIDYDKDISLYLESAPPYGPEEYAYNQDEHFQNNPFQGI
ncbi:MAG: hypothetical protein PHH37_00840 [Paludibacter sp.]|nr:hypothetical protein [Paludibacter sp.]